MVDAVVNTERRGGYVQFPAVVKSGLDLAATGQRTGPMLNASCIAIHVCTVLCWLLEEMCDKVV